MKIQSSSNINKYLKTVSAHIKDGEFPLENLDPRKIEGIQRDIVLFEDTSIEEIKFLSKRFQVLNLMRGCREQCTFCLRNALKPIKKTAQNINTILWEDLTRFTEGVSKLNERLGFNIFRGNSHITLFEDANLPDIVIKDLQNRSHSVKESVQEIYEKLGLPVVFVTAGWSPMNKAFQKSAEELCGYIRHNPDCVKEFAVSINPFHRYDEDFYTTKMANTLKTFLPLYTDGTASILLKYNYPNGIDVENNGYDAARKLYEAIFEKLKLLTGNNLDEYPALSPQKVTRHRADNYIENKGRGQDFFSAEAVEKQNNKLFVESFQWHTMTAEQKRQFAYNFMIKNIDINGHIYLITPSEQLIRTDMKLNFINKDKLTAPIHSDIKFKDFLTLV